MAIAVLLACASLLVTGAAGARADASRPPLPANGKELTPGQLPRPCAAGETDLQGYYFSDAANQWVQAPFCYGKWGNLIASPSQIVDAGSPATVTAIPTDGSNSGTYAPQTGAIQWDYQGQVVSGCGASDMSCTVIPAKAATTEWQWFEFHVSMPRTFFIDSPGDLCGGQHLCAGATTNAWSYVGIPPIGTDARSASSSSNGGSSAGLIAAALALAAAAAAAVALKSRGGGPSIGDIQRAHTDDPGGDPGKGGGGKPGGGKPGGSKPGGHGGSTPGGGKSSGGNQPKGDTSGRRGITVPGQQSGRPGKARG